jgi:hypothetical protein
VLGKSSLIFVWVIAQADAQDKPLPKFEDFKVTEVFKGAPAKPILQSSGDRMFRTRIREGAARGPNFAGHFTIAVWGCGSSCVSFALVDAKTGEVFHAPFGILESVSMLGYDDIRPDAKHADVMGLKYQQDSRLLIARGCPDEKDEDCASFYYEWTGTQFKLLRKLPAKPR